jgi:hypothetical protein
MAAANEITRKTIFDAPKLADIIERYKNILN